MPNYERALWADGSKFGTETIDKAVKWFSNTSYGKRFNEAQARDRELTQKLVNQGGPYAQYHKIKNTPNPIEQKVLKGISDITNIDERITTPATYLAISGGMKGLSKLKPKHLGISQTIEQLPKRIQPTAPPRKLLNITDVNANRSIPISGNRPVHQVRTLPDWWKRPLKISKEDQVKMGLNQPMAFTEQDALKIYPGKGKSVSKRKAILADNPTAAAYRELLDKHSKLNENSESMTIGKKQVKISPLPKEEFEADVKKLIELKTELGLPSAKQFRDELGAFVKDGELYRWGSKGELKIENYEGQKKRVENQQSLPTGKEFDEHRPEWGPFVDSERQKLTTKLGLPKPEKDHLVRLENQVAILSNTLDSNGGFVKRPPEFMNQLAGELHRRGYHLGDQNLNFLQMSELAHRTGKYSRHVVSQELTDAELPHTYLEADEIFTELQDGTKKWLDVEVIDINKGTYRLKDGDKIIPNKLIKSKGNYKFAGKEFEKGQRQGLSLTTRKVLARIDNPKELADAYELFATDAGAHEIMSGIQTAASYIYDNPAELDALSKQIRKANTPNMIKFLKYALKTPQYKNDPVYTKLLNQFVNKLHQNMSDYKEQLKIRGS